MLNAMPVPHDELRDDLSQISILAGDRRIGDFLVRPLLKRVVRLDENGGAQEEHRLPDKAMGVLVFLAERPRQVCTRADILDAVWGEDRDSYDRVLDNAVAEIRRVVGDDARRPSYIQTIPKTGYRLLMAVDSRPGETTEIASALDPESRSSEQAAMPARPKRSPTADPRADDDRDVPVARSARRRQRWSKDRRLRISLVAAAGLLIAFGILALTSTKPSYVVVTFDTTGLGGSETSATAGPGKSMPPRHEVMEALNQTLFADHACGESNLLRPEGWLHSADFTVHLRTRPDTGADHQTDTVLSAEVGPSESREIVLLRTDSPEGNQDAMVWGFAREVARKLDRAACRFEKAPKAARACHCLNTSQMVTTQSSPQEEIEDLELAVVLDPELVPAYGPLANALHMTGDPERAMAVLQTGLSRIADPDSTQALSLRLQLARLLEDPTAVERLLDRLVQRHPDDPRWILERATFLTWHRRDCEQALAVLQPLLEEEQSFIPTIMEVALALWICDQREEGLTLLLASAEQFPREVGIRLVLASALSLRGRFEEAARYAAESVALEPGLADSYWIHGVVAERQGHYSAATTWFEKALALATWPTQELRAKLGLARTARLRGEFPLCVERLDGLQSNPDLHEWPQMLRAVCLVASGRLSEAHAVRAELDTSISRLATEAGFAWEFYVRGFIDLASASSEEARNEAAEWFVAAAEARPIRIDWFRSEAARVMRRDWTDR